MGAANYQGSVHARLGALLAIAELATPSFAPFLLPLVPLVLDKLPDKQVKKVFVNSSNRKVLFCVS